MARFQVSVLCCLWAIQVGHVPASAQVPPLRHDFHPYPRIECLPPPVWVQVPPLQPDFGTSPRLECLPPPVWVQVPPLQPDLGTFPRVESLPQLTWTQAPPLRHDLSEYPCSGTEALAFRPDSKLLASTRNRGELRLWDVATGELLDKVDHSGGMDGFVTDRGLAFSPDGKTLAVGMASGIETTGHIFLWDVQDGNRFNRRTILKDHTEGVLGLAFTPDGKTLLSAGYDKEIRLWDVSTGETRSILRGHQERILGMALSGDGQVLATGDPDEVKVWDLQTGQETASWEVVELVDLALSPDGKILAVALWNEAGITFWDVASGKRRADLKPLSDATGPMTFSPDGRRFVAVNRNRYARATVTVTNLADGSVRFKYPHGGGHVHVVAWSPDGKFLVSGDSDDSANAQLHLRDVSELLLR